MTTTRLEAFSDGVVAILITIMVLELRPPHEATLEGLKPLIPVLMSHLPALSFRDLLTNHHYLIHAAEHVNGRVGQPSPTLLALVNSLCYGLDGRESFF